MNDRSEDQPSDWPSNRPLSPPTDPRQSDAAAGFEILDGFKRFDQRDDVFSRAWWDETVHSQKVIDFYNGSNDPKIRTADGSGTSSTSIAIGAKGGVSAGETKRYQHWYRTTTNPPCGLFLNDFNLTNGLEITWLP